MVARCSVPVQPGRSPVGVALRLPCAACAGCRGGSKTIHYRYRATAPCSAGVRAAKRSISPLPTAIRPAGHHFLHVVLPFWIGRRLTATARAAGIDASSDWWAGSA